MLCELQRLFCGDSHSNNACHFALIVKVHTAALIDRVHEVPGPVRVHLARGLGEMGLR
jgi:hypothetical protein